MVLIYMSHAELVDPHQTDCGITSSGWSEAKRVANSLVARYGVPDVIYMSPYLSCSLTANAMKEVLPDCVIFEYDHDLGKYLKRRYQRCEVKLDTRLHGAILDETYNEFKCRVRKQYDRVSVLCRERKVWNITHPCVLKEISKIYDVRVPRHFCITKYLVINCYEETSCWTESETCPSEDYCGRCNNWRRVCLCDGCGRCRTVCVCIIPKKECCCRRCKPSRDHCGRHKDTCSCPRCRGADFRCGPRGCRDYGVSTTWLYHM